MPVIGMIHVQATPGSPNYSGNVDAIIEHALCEAEIYRQAGIDGIAIENMHDVPYLNSVIGHETSSLMAIIGYQIKKATRLPVGLQLLAAANKAALAAAHSAGLDFIRAEGFVFGHVADEGYIDGCAGALLRFRKNIGADSVAVFTDIKKKHSSHAITDDISILETAKAAEFFLSDALIVTGKATGERADLDELKLIKENSELPVIIGSGVTAENVDNYAPFCDAMIVGSYFKKGGYWANEIQKDKVEYFMNKVRGLRG